VAWQPFLISKEGKGMREHILHKIVVAIIIMLFPTVIFANKPPDDTHKADR
jgi:hypothetical protein